MGKGQGRQKCTGSSVSTCNASVFCPYGFLKSPYRPFYGQFTILSAMEASKESRYAGRGIPELTPVET